MMVTIRVIPCLDVDRGRVVKGVNFVGLRDAGDPVELASRYDREGADEVVLLDLTASSHAGPAVGGAPSTTPVNSCGPAPTRCPSTPPRWIVPRSWRSWPRSSAPS